MKKRFITIGILLLLLTIPTVLMANTSKTWDSVPIKMENDKVNERPLTSAEKRLVERLSRLNKKKSLGTQDKITDGIEVEALPTVSDVTDYSTLVPRDIPPWTVISDKERRTVTSDPSANNRKTVKGDESDIRNIMEWGLSVMGNRYFLSGENPFVPFEDSTAADGGTDCSRFVYLAYHYGANIDIISRYTGAMITDLGIEVPQDQILPGDILLFVGNNGTRITDPVGHAGLYLGDRKYMHFSTSRSPSTVATLAGEPGNFAQGSGNIGILKSVRRVIIKE